MDRQAKVTSVEALGAFRSSLVIYLTSVGNALDEVRDEVRRTRVWIQQDQRTHWSGQHKRTRKQLEQAESELFTSRLSAMTSHSAARQMAVTRLRRKVREIEEKLGVLKKWTRNYDNLVDPLVKKLDGLQHLLTHEMPKAVSTLVQSEQALDAYRRVAAEDGGPAESSAETGAAGDKITETPEEDA